MSQDQFDDLKKRLQECEHTTASDEDTIFCQSRLMNPGYIPEQLKIMESGIFYEGQLRGRQSTGRSRDYAKYQIYNIEGFVFDVVYNIYDLKGNITKKYFDVKIFCSEFESSNYDSMITLLRKRFGISTVKKMEYIKKIVMEFESELLSEMRNDTKKPIYKNVQPIFDVFKHYIPDAPNQTIADRISELLAKFDINVKANTMLQRIYRAKK
jgi:hypothetical protein